MNASFFHQAHLNNWSLFREILNGSRWAAPWDDVVLTAANTRQAQAYQYQLDLRRKLDMLPTSTSFHVIPDPQGQRVGSGGATLHVLSHLAKKLSGASDEATATTLDNIFQKRKILLLHSGGDSKRLPQYSAFGKIFAPIPRLLVSGRPSTLFDELFAALIGLPSRMNPGVVTASGDVLLLFDHSQLALNRPGFTGIAIPAPPAIASHHGVFVAQDGPRVEAFLHKPSLPLMQKAGALRNDGNVAIDTGIVYFDPTVATQLCAAAYGTDSWLEDVIQAGIPLNFYGDFLKPLAPATDHDDYIHDTSDSELCPAIQDLREKIWQKLRGTDFFAQTLAPAKFLHFGSTREYLQLVTMDDTDIQALGGRRRISHFHDDDCLLDENICLLHSSIGSKTTIARGSVVEFSEIGQSCRLQGECIVSNIALPPGSTVPPKTVIHALPVLQKNASETAHVVRIWGVDDNPKTAFPDCTLFGKPLKELLEQWEITPLEIWPEASSNAERTLWNARLYPVGLSLSEAWNRSAWLLQRLRTPQNVLAAPPTAWLQSQRESLHSSYEDADMAAVETYQENLFADLIFNKCQRFFRQECPAAQWFDKIPTTYDLGNLVHRMANETQNFTDPLLAMRWNYSIATLIKHHPQPLALDCDPKNFESLAFTQLAQCILKTHHEQQQRLRTTKRQWQRDSATASLPVRIDFAGGWSDTPPHTLEKGGTVLNAAIRLEEQMPVQVEIRRLDEPVVRLQSRDLQVDFETKSLSDITEYANPHDPLAIHKAALCLFGLSPDSGNTSLENQLNDLGGGILVSTHVRVPKGSGLGTSSVLAAGLAKAFLTMTAPDGQQPQLETLLSAAFAIEQMLTTGGGWQDQVGGLYPGLKLTTAPPGIRQELEVHPLVLPDHVRKELDDRLVVIDTGQRRLARNLLREIMGDWLARTPTTVRIIHDIQKIAFDMQHAFCAGELQTVGNLMWQHWEMNKQLDAQTSNEFIETIIHTLRPHLEGAKLAGAGGGGFLFGIAKPGAKPCITSLVSEAFAGTNVKLYDAKITW